MSSIPVPSTRGGQVIRVRGEDLGVSSLDLGLTRLLSACARPRRAKLFDEELIESSVWPSIDHVCPAIEATGLRVGQYSSSRPFEPGFNLPGAHCQSYELAVPSTRSYDELWVGQSRQTHRNFKIADERGVITRAVVNDDVLSTRIKRICNDTPLRQGRNYWRFRRPLARVKEIYAIETDLSQFIAAHWKKLIGILKYLRVDRVAMLIQVLTSRVHCDKRAFFALELRRK